MARDDAPPPRLSIDDITAAGRQLARRRRTALLSSVAGGVAAVIAGATAAIVLFAPTTVTPTVGPNGNPGTTEAAPSPARRADFTRAAAFETNYSGYTSGKYIVGAPELVTAGYQQSAIDLNPAAPATSASVSAASVSPTRAPDVVPREGRLVVYGAGLFDTRQFAGGEKLTVGGRLALLRHAGSPSAVPSVDGKYGCCIDPTVPTLAWQYLPDAWAAIYWSSLETAPTRAELLALAEALPADDPRPFPVGLHLRDMPKGYRLIAASTRTSSYDELNLSVVRLGMKPLVAPFTAPAELNKLSSVVLTLGVTDQVQGQPIGKTTCPPGGTACAVLIGDGQFFMQVESVGDRRLAETELMQILKSMSAEQPDDRTSWPPAATVFKP